MNFQLIESPSDRIRDYLLYHVEWICACFCLVLVILLLAGQVVGQNQHIRELENPDYLTKLDNLHGYMKSGKIRYIWRQEYCK